MPLAGLVINRVTETAVTGVSPEAALAGAERLAGEDDVTSGLLRLHADQLARIARESALRHRFAAAHPAVRTATVEALATDVHDLESLRVVGADLAA
jgi:hypothetical protein